MGNQFKFFIVDDDMFCGKTHKQTLTSMGHVDITYYANGTDCLNNLDQKPDVIFLDHTKEHLTEFEVLKKIKHYNPNIYVVMVSGQETIKTAVNALKYGAFVYNIKDDSVSEKMEQIINKIVLVKRALKKSNPSFIQRMLFLF